MFTTHQCLVRGLARLVGHVLVSRQHPPSSKGGYESVGAKACNINNIWVVLKSYVPLLVVDYFAAPKIQGY